MESEKRSALEMEKGKKRKAVETELERMNELKNQLYTSVICHRIRDVFTPIRELIIRFLGIHWFVYLLIGDLIRTCPESYCIDDYLKYIGVALSDKDATVRIEAVSQLTVMLEAWDLDDE